MNLTRVDKRKLLTGATAFLFLYAAWNTVERTGFLVGMAALGRANAAQGVGPAQLLGTGLSLVNLLSALFSILAWWAVAALAWVIHSEPSA